MPTSAFLFDKYEKKGREDGQTEREIEGTENAELIPKKTGDERGRQGAEADNHLKAPQTAGPICLGTEFGHESFLHRIKRATVQTI